MQNPQLRLIKWWRKKYSIPFKPIEDYTFEELFVEFLEDFYDIMRNPVISEGR